MFLVALCGLAAARLILPYAVRAHVVRTLEGIPDYEVSIGDLDMNLWRGAYEVEDLRLYKESRGDGEPFFEVARLDIAVHWGALLRGAAVENTVLHRPVLRFVDAATEESSQTGIDVSWHERYRDLFPFYLDRFAVRDGEIHYAQRDADGTETVDLFVTDLYLEARNLTGIRGTERALPARVEAAARPFGTGELEAVLVLDPLADTPRLDLSAEVRDLALIELNDFFQTYGSVDVEEGTLALYSEMAVVGERFDGYVKTLLEGVRVLGFGEFDDPLEALWEAFVGLGVEVLENQPHDRLATRIPLEGTTSEVEADVWVIVGSLLRNAFIEALRPALDRSIDAVDPIDDTAGAEGGRG